MMDPSINYVCARGTNQKKKFFAQKCFLDTIYEIKKNKK